MVAPFPVDLCIDRSPSPPPFYQDITPIHKNTTIIYYSIISTMSSPVQKPTAKRARTNLSQSTEEAQFGPSAADSSPSTALGMILLTANFTTYWLSLVSTKQRSPTSVITLVVWTNAAKMMNPAVRAGRDPTPRAVTARTPP